MTAAALSNLDLDEHVDVEIATCLNRSSPRNFFLFAGAGSGKTRSLQGALNHIQKCYGAELRLEGRGVAVITYTNAACDEIKRRVSADPLFTVSTIHSFAWSLIGGFNSDIRDWLRLRIRSDISKLEDDEKKGRPGTKVSQTRQADMASKRERLTRLDTIRTFIYNPTGDNVETNSLNHAEVINICAAFLSEKPVMQRILVAKFPFLLIDESQDTNKQLVDAFLIVAGNNPDNFCIGFFGDMMQRIYADGKEGFEKAIPDSWAKPRKQLNHRCPKRIVGMINQIRKAADGQVQSARSDSIEGHIRLFVMPSATVDRAKAEESIRLKMAEITTDNEWQRRASCKILTLEHHMSARRSGFDQLFEALYQISEFRTGLLDGTLPALRFFSERVLPLLQAHRDGSKHRIAKIVRDKSPLLSADALRDAPSAQAQLQVTHAAVAGLLSLWASSEPQCVAILRNISASGIFVIPESLKPFSVLSEADFAIALTEMAAESEGSKTKDGAMLDFLSAPFSQVEQYASYIGEHSEFDTHQGVKGLEFDRVMVVMDDAEARGFLFSFDKLLGAKERSATDIRNESEGRETTFDRTRRLFYVTCSRAMKSLALVVYTDQEAAVRSSVVKSGWFLLDEIA